MFFYKILKQEVNNKSFFYELFDSDSYFVTDNPLSFALRYHPETYNDFFENDTVYDYYLDASVKQLFITNQKFRTIIKYKDNFGLKLLNCKFDEGDIDEFLDSDEQISIETIDSIIEETDNRISNTVYVTESGEQLVLQKNGVIGFDKDLKDMTLDEEEKSSIIKLINTLNFGLRGLKP